MREYNETIDRFLDAGATLLLAEIDKVTPRVTQRLAGDLTIFPTTHKGERSVGNSALIDYAKFVYYGTKPHIIKPKNKKALKTPYGYRKRVKHPGTKANPYLDIGLKNMINSGKLHNLLDDFSDNMSQKMFENISKGLKNLKI